MRLVCIHNQATPLREAAHVAAQGKWHKRDIAR